MNLPPVLQHAITLVAGALVTGVLGYFGIAAPQERRVEVAEYEQAAAMRAYEILSHVLEVKEATLEKREELLEKRAESRARWRDRAKACEEQCPMAEAP